jgi:hypothetical protein
MDRGGEFDVYSEWTGTAPSDSAFREFGRLYERKMREGKKKRRGGQPRAQNGYERATRAMTRVSVNVREQVGKENSAETDVEAECFEDNAEDPEDFEGGHAFGRVTGDWVKEIGVQMGRESNGIVGSSQLKRAFRSRTKPG